MPAVLHLALIDLRRIRWAAAAWLVVYLSVPLGMERLAHTPVSLEGPFRPFGGGAPWLPLVSLFIEPLMAWLVTAVVVQSDAPCDGRAFWRTRPIAPTMLVAGKATALAALLVGLPIVVAVVRFATYGVPAISLLTIAIQLAISRAAWIAIGLLLAALTGTLPRLILLLLGLSAAVMATLSMLPFIVAGDLDVIHVGIGSVSIGFLGIGAPPNGYASFLSLWLLMAVGTRALYAWRSRAAAVGCAVAALAAATFGPAIGQPDAVPLAAGMRDRVETTGRLHAIHLVPDVAPPGTAPDAPMQLRAQVALPELPIQFTADLPELVATVRTANGTRTSFGRSLSGMHGLPSQGLAAGLTPCTAPAMASSFFCRRELEITVADLREEARIGLRSGALNVEVQGTLHVVEHRAVAVLPVRRGVSIRRPDYLLEILQVEQRATGIGLAGRFTRFPSLRPSPGPRIALFVRRGGVGMELAIVPRGLPGTLTLQGPSHSHTTGTWGANVQELFYARHGLERQPYPVTPSADWLKDVELVVIESTYVGSTRVRWTANDLRIESPSAGSRGHDLDPDGLRTAAGSRRSRLAHRAGEPELAADLWRQVPGGPPSRTLALRGPLDHHGIARDENLRGTAHDVRRREADVDDRIGAARGGHRRHPVDGLLAGLGHQLRVLLDLAADHVLERGEDVLPDVAGPDGVAVDEAERADHPVPGDVG